MTHTIGSHIRVPHSAFRVRAAFTLIEVLVVVSIITVLVGILVPSVQVAIESGRTSKCLAGIRNIGTAFVAYQLDHRGEGHPRRNFARWFPIEDTTNADPLAGTPLAGTVYEPEDTEHMIEPSDPNAYWGVAYVKWGAPKEIYNCPSATAVNEREGENPDGTWAQGHIYTTYIFSGATQYLASTTEWSPWFSSRNGASDANPATVIRNPAGTVLAQDGVEVMPEGNNDLPYELTFTSIAKEKLQYIRHRGGAAIVWGDGHAEHYRPPNESFTPEDWPAHWYVRARDQLGRPN